MTNDLTVIDPLRTALANATTVEDFRGVRDMASAARAWAKARGLGIQSENDAAEYILRAERRIGQVLETLREEGRLAQRGPTGVPADGSLTLRVVVAMSERPTLSTREIAALMDVTLSKASAFLWKVKVFQHVGRGLWAVNDAELARRNANDEWRVSLEDLNITANQSHEFQQAAAVPDDVFERMLGEARANVTRLAKVNFYRAGREARGMKAPPVTPEDANFDLFRRGIYGMLGWVNNEDFVGPTKNGLLMLPGDELEAIKVLVQHLAQAWKEATDARR